MEEESEGHGLGMRLRRILSVRGENLKDFAARSEIPYRTLQNHVSGRIKPNSDQLSRFSNAGIDVNFLLTGRPLSSIQRLGSIFAKTEEQYYLMADEEVATALNKTALDAVDLYTSRLLEYDIEFTFGQLYDVYLIVVRELMRISVLLDIPVVEARKLGMSVPGMIKTMTTSALQVFASNLANEIIAEQKPSPSMSPG